MGTSWVLTKELAAFRDQMNRAFPTRDKTSDGAVGDLAHQKESASSHNPDRTGAAEWKDGDSLNEVRAIDVDSDLRTPDVSMEDVVQHLLRLARAGKLSVIRYMIYNHRIWSASDGWKQQAYTGPSPHTEHLHLTGAFTEAADNAASFNFHLDDLVGDDLVTTQAEFNTLMDSWWVGRMSPNAADNAARAALRVAPWQQVVGRSTDSTHTVLFGEMRTNVAKAADEDVDEDAVAQAVLAGLDPTKIADAVVAALPADEAKQVADELAARLAA